MMSRRRSMRLGAAAAIVLFGVAAALAADYPWVDDSPAGANDFTCRPTTAHPNPVVLVHGLGANMNANWGRFSPALAAEGYCVFALNYGRRTDVPPPFDHFGGVIRMEESVVQLSDFIDRVLTATGAAKVDIVGHSEGSLMPDYYVKFLGGAAKVDKYVGMTPLWDGTNLALAGTLTAAGKPSGPSDAVLALFGEFCPSCPEFIQGSDFLNTLNAGGAAVPGVTYTMIMTKDDELVVPYTSGYLDGANNIVVQDQCPNDVSEHILMAVDPVVLRDILNALDPASAEPPTCGTL
jgi:triacylglycerol lipase